MTDGGLRAYLESERAPVEAALERCADAMAPHLPSAVRAAVRAGVLSGGKRVRPLLLVTGFRETGGLLPADPSPLYDLAAAVECIHAYSLVHDDLPCMDDAPLRRDLPTVHAAHGPAVAGAAGAALIPWATLWALRGVRGLGRPEADARRIARTLLEAAGAGGMVGGQALDLLAEGRSLSEAEMEAVHRLKTGALLSAAPVMGAVAAGAGESAMIGLSRYGRDLGLAFQVMDDVLDATGSAETLGKRPSDHDFGKSTYVALLGVKGARRRAAELMAGAQAALDAADLAAPRLRQLAQMILDRRR